MATPVSTQQPYPRCMAAALDGQCHQGFPRPYIRGLWSPASSASSPLIEGLKRDQQFSYKKIGILGGCRPLKFSCQLFWVVSLKKNMVVVMMASSCFFWCSTPNKNETRLILADVGWWNTTNLATTTCTKWQATPSHGMCFLAKKDPERIGTWTLKVTIGVHLRNLT